MPRLTKNITIKNPQGLHARPAALIVQLISKFNCEVTFQKDNQKVNGKSIMGILTLGAHHNTVLTVDINGDDAQELFDELDKILSKESIDE